MSDESAITVYGTDTCADCRRSRAVLEAEQVPYRWVDIAASEAAAGEALAVSGRTSTPVIVFPDGSHLVEPSDEALRTKLAAD